MNIKGIFSGITEDRFAPDENITRAMAVTVLWRMDGENDAKDQQLTFNDVDPQGYYSDAVRWGVSTGIVQGYSDISFGPDRLISREEFATIMKRYAGYKNIDTSETADLSGFVDSETIADWAEESVSWAVGYGLISGKNDGMLDPKGFTTRAEAAAILQRFLKK